MRTIVFCFIGLCLCCTSFAPAGTAWALALHVEPTSTRSDYAAPGKKITITSASSATFRPVVICQSPRKRTDLEYHPLATTLYLPAPDYRLLERFFTDTVLGARPGSTFAKDNMAPTVTIACAGCDLPQNPAVLSAPQVAALLQAMENTASPGQGASRSASKKLSVLVRDLRYWVGVRP